MNSIAPAPAQPRHAPGTHPWHTPDHPPDLLLAVGAIIGFSLVYGGKDAVNWATPEPKLFPPYSGVVPIVSAWIFAPLATASAAALIMFLCRTFVLRRNNPARLAMYVLPLAVFLTTWINIYFVFTKVGASGGGLQLRVLAYRGWPLLHPACLIA